MHPSETVIRTDSENLETVADPSLLADHPCTAHAEALVQARCTTVAAAICIILTLHAT